MKGLICTASTALGAIAAAFGRTRNQTEVPCPRSLTEPSSQVLQPQQSASRAERKSQWQLQRPQRPGFVAAAAAAAACRPPPRWTSQRPRSRGRSGAPCAAARAPWARRADRNFPWNRPDFPHSNFKNKTHPVRSRGLGRSGVRVCRLRGGRGPGGSRSGARAGRLAQAGRPLTSQHG